ncbi:unnamed protein product [Calypogeia fissa]
MALLQLQLPVLQSATAGGAVFETSNSNNMSFLSSASHVGVGCDHSSFPYSLGRAHRQSSASAWSHFWRPSQGNKVISTHQRFSGYAIVSRSDSQLSSESRSSREDGYRSSPRTDSSRRNDFNPEFSSGRDRQDRNYRNSEFNREDSSGGGRQDGYASAPRPDFRRSQGNNLYSSQQRSSGGGRGGGRQNAYASSATSSSRSSDPRRNHQGSNSNFQRGSDDGYGDVDATTRSYPRRGEGDNFNSFQRGRPGGNDGGRPVGARDGARYGARDGGRGRDSRAGGQGKGGKVSGRSSSSNPSPATQTFTPRQSTSQFVSDRTIYRAPWEQRPSRGSGNGSSSSGSTSSWRGTRESDVAEENPLIERLKRMQEEVEDEDEDDDDDAEDDEDFDGLRHDSNRRFRDFNDEVPYDGTRQDSAMARIVEKLSKIPGSREVYRSRGRDGVGVSDEGGVGPKYGQPMFPAVGRGWSTPDNPVPTPGAPSSERFRPDTRFPWEREDGRGEAKAPDKLTRVRPPSMAELTLPEDELKRLRSLGILTRHRIKVGKLGITNSIVEAIHSEWRSAEVVRIKCEGLPAQNMKRTHETIEERTGGLVVWRAGGACLVYRGKDYVPPPLRGMLDFSGLSTSSSVGESEESRAENEAGLEKDSQTEDMEEGVEEQKVEPKIIVPKVSSIYDPELEQEMEEILSTLGPRYDDWTGMKPVPVDADLLGGPDYKFRKPFRQLPYGVKPNLSNVELTNLRRLGRPIPPHFVLGINRGLEGLAGAIVKFWEKSEIVKISVKRGVQNTNHERMAEQLKRLTGGVLLSRDKYFIVLYRGKDFLPPSVAAVLEERRAMTSELQEEEEKARLLPSSTEVSYTSVESSISGTLAETLEAKANWERLQNSEEQLKVAEEARKAQRREVSRRIHRKVAITMAKKHKAELELEKVEKRLRPAGPPVDRENITEEERHMFSKLGLKMHAFLLLGRRGIFDGTVENMHLHWKHRPLVKVIYKATDRVDLEQTARMLEYESGGILVATIPTNKGQAIIVYRGKNYQRPPELRPRTLLTKRQALKRSIEMQRQQALTKHLLTLEKEIETMKADLSKLGADDKEDVHREDDEEDVYREDDEEDVYREDDEEDDEEDGEEDDEESLATTAAAEDSQDETKESTTLDLESPKDDGESIKEVTVRNANKLQNPDLIYRADPLSRRERLILRQQALKEKKRAAHFNVGRSNVLAGLARAIRIHFRKHALVKVGVKGRARGTPVEEILYELEAATGGTLVSHEHSKVILYRGWPEGQQNPTEETGRWEELPPQLRSAMIAEVEADDDYLHESDWEESDDEDGDEDIDGEGDVDKEYFESRAAMDDLEGDDDDEDDDEDEEADVANEYLESRAAMDGLEVDDDSEWGKFEEDDNEDDGYLENALGHLPEKKEKEEEEDDEDKNKAEDEHVSNEGVVNQVAVNDAV